MRFAFISDIHGNLDALEVVLADVQSMGADQIVCLGDIASLGPQPSEVITRLRQLQMPIIMGNHETYLLNPQLTEKHHPWLRAVELWCLEQLTADDLNFLNAFPPQLHFTLEGGKTMLCFHGTPRSNEEWLYPTTPSATLDEIFTGQTARVLVGGHTHVQMVSQHRGAMLLNPGSVGMPFEFPMRGPNQHIFRHAEYALLDINGGILTAQLRHLPIDFEHLAQVTRASGMPDFEFWLSTWDV